MVVPVRPKTMATSAGKERQKNEFTIKMGKLIDRRSFYRMLQKQSSVSRLKNEVVSSEVFRTLKVVHKRKRALIDATDRNSVRYRSANCNICKTVLNKLSVFGIG